MDVTKRRVISVSLTDGDGGIRIAPLDCQVLHYGPVVIMKDEKLGQVIPTHSSYEQLCLVIKELWCEHGANAIMIERDVTMGGVITQTGKRKEVPLITLLEEYFKGLMVRVTDAPLVTDASARELLLAC